MQTANHSHSYSQEDQTPKEIAVTLILGVLIGLLVFLFFKSLQWIEIQHLILNERLIPYHLIGLPVVIVLLSELKKRTLYFPSKISEVTKPNLELVHHWSPGMMAFHFIGNTVSHFVGASVGREGTAVMMSAGLIRLLKLSWNFWGPVAMTVGFSAVAGEAWVSIFFMNELFNTHWKQKLYGFIGSFSAVLLLKTLNAPHLFSPIVIESNFSFFQKLIFVIALGATSGYLMRCHKWLYFYLTNYFSKSGMWVKVFVACLLAAFLAVPGLRKFQSLGLLQIDNLVSLSPHLSDVIIKLFVTLISVSLGFWGGEFIPLVFAGVHFGYVVSNVFQFDLMLGMLLSAYLFFAGATRMKWTAIVLTLSIVGWGWWFWVFLLVSTSVGFSGPTSIYKTNH